MTRKQLNWLILFLVVVVTLLPFLGLCWFNTKGEPREAIVAVTMLQSGNWILPVNYGYDIQFKPPLLYWLIAVFSRVFGGEVTEFTSRLPSALAALAMIMAGYGFYRRQARSTAVAMAAAVLTLTAFEVHRAATSCRLDMLVTAMIVMAIYALYLHSETRERRWFWASVALMALGALTKGPVGAVLPCLVAGVYRLLRGRRFWPTFGVLALAGVLALVPLCAWYGAAWMQGGEEFRALMLEENVGRMTGTMSYESHTNPVYYNFLTVAAGMLPYTLLVAISLPLISYRRPGWLGRGVWRRVCALDAPTLLSLVTVAVIFLFYCIPASKRSVYLLPIYPSLCYFLALYVRRLCRRHPSAVSAFGWIIAALSLLLPLVFVAVRFGFLGGVGGRSMRVAVEGLTLSPLYWWQVLLLALSWCSGVVLCRSLVTEAPSRKFLVTAATIITVYWSFSGVYQPAVLNAKSDYPMTRAITAMYPADPYYYTWGMQLHTMNFYTADRMRRFEDATVNQGVLILADSQREDFASAYPGVMLEEIWCSPTDSRSGDLRRTVTAYRFAR